jgi:membrane-associated protease RseP (regulator of RpoE activity)
MRRIVVWAAAVGLAACPVAARADDPVKKPTPTTGAKQAYMGVDLEPLPHALASQLPGVLPKGQGVLIGFVEKGSPAEKAGMQADDVLLSFNKTDVYSPDQLIKVVRETKPGTTVVVGLVRGGKATTADVTIGEHERSAMRTQEPFGFRLIPDENFRKMIEHAMGMNAPSPWNSFDAMKLTRGDGDKWKAEIEYRTTDGKKEHKTFEGTRDQILKDVKAEKNLPAEERNDLIRMVNGNGPSFDFLFPWSDMVNPSPDKAEVPPVPKRKS